MIGIVLFAHNQLAENFLDVLTTIAGEQKQMIALGVEVSTAPEEIERRLDKTIKLVNTGEGVVILADLFGGSPANCSLARLAPGRVEVVSGLNLAMLLKVVDLRNRNYKNARDMAQEIAREGRDNIVLASDILKSGQNSSTGLGGGVHCQK